MDIQNFFPAENIEWKEVDPGVFRRVLAYHDDLMVCHLHFLKGAVGKLHTHPHSQCTYILSGKFEFQIGEKKKTLSAGDSTYKQPFIEHGAVCLEEGYVLDIFTPYRKEFVE